MADIEVWIDWRGLKRVGVLRRYAGKGRERVSFEYSRDWLNDQDSFAITPALPLTRGSYVPEVGQDMIAALGDTSPDTWGRTVMRRVEGRQARSEGRKPATLQESDYLIGVNDETRLGALRFKVGDEYQAVRGMGVPAIISLGDLLAAAQRVLAGTETNEDLLILFSQGSSLGGARPKASIFDQHNRLSVAKFPKESDEYSVERWEAITLDMARASGIKTADYTLENVGGRPVILSHRFDRKGADRIPFASAMALLNGVDGESYSYLDLVDFIASESRSPESDWAELFRRVAFTILVTNTDDHMRNHGFLRRSGGWELSPAYDINPTPSAPRILKSYVSEDDADASIDLLRESAKDYLIEADVANTIITEVAVVTREWRTFAAKRHAPAREITLMETAFEHEESEALRRTGAGK